MFIDFITLLLANMTAGLLVLATFFGWGAGRERARAWAPALAVVGLVALVGGFYMALTWPVREMGERNVRWANPAFGEMTVLFGAAFLGAAGAVRRGRGLVPVTVYAAVAGGVAMVVGARLWGLGLTQTPRMTGIGFLLTGALGPLALAAAGLPRSRVARTAAALVAAGAAGLWAMVAVKGYWGHLAMWSP